jgi:hypothetical protein
MTFLPKQPLWYAWLSVKPGDPVVAQIAEVFWLRADKLPNTSRVQYAGNKFGLVAPDEHLHTNAADARKDLVAQIQKQAQDVDYQKQMLWNALADLDRTAIIDWPKPTPTAPPVKIVAPDEEIPPVEPAIINPIARLKQNIVAQAARDRRQASLIANAQRAARKHPPRPKQ